MTRLDHAAYALALNSAYETLKNKGEPRAVSEDVSFNPCCGATWMSSASAGVFLMRKTPLRLMAFAGALLWAQGALAHAIVVRTSPAQGGVAAGNIGKVEVWYDAGIRDAFVALAVVSASGERVDKRDAAIDSADAAHVSVGVNQLTPGKYTARYRALSADGHIVSGSWDFEITP